MEQIVHVMCIVYISYIRIFTDNFVSGFVHFVVHIIIIMCHVRCPLILCLCLLMININSTCTCVPAMNAYTHVHTTEKKIMYTHHHEQCKKV